VVHRADPERPQVAAPQIVGQAGPAHRTGRGREPGPPREQREHPGKPGEFPARQRAVLVGVEFGEQGVGEAVAVLREWSAVGGNPQPHGHRPQVGEVQHVDRFRGRHHGGAQEERGKREERTVRGPESTSLIAAAVGSTSRIGRPTFDGFCFSGLSPSAVQTVASRSGTLTGRSFTSIPSALVAPTAWPPLIPPPASTVDQEFAQWSRPFCWLILGVRPNSPIQTIVVVSKSPRSFRSSSRADHAWSSTPQSRLTDSKLFWWVSHPIPFCTPGAEDRVTSTNGTPRSTSRRASRHPWPKSVRP